VSTRGFYEEFDSREALLLSIHDELNDSAFAAVVTALAGLDVADAPARIHAGVAAYLGVMTADPQWARVAVIETVAVSPEAERHRRAQLDRFTALLQDEFERLARLGIAPMRRYGLAARAVVGAFTELVSAWSTSPDAIDLRELAAEAEHFVSAAVAAPPKARRRR
jgi:AcrR family transcriptional regulator